MEEKESIINASSFEQAIDIVSYMFSKNGNITRCKVVTETPKFTATYGECFFIERDGLMLVIKINMVQ